MELLLMRQYHELGVNGTLSLEGKKISDMIELPWRQNKRRVSCIPEGRYRLGKRYTPRFGWHCWVYQVPGRDAILIHAFNNALAESKGCIAPVSQITGQGSGTSSRPALRRLMQILEPAFAAHEPVFLTIQSNNNDNPQPGTKAHA